MPEKRTANCRYCGIEFVVKSYSKGLYCSRSCRGKAACGQRENGLRWKGGDVTIRCTNCGTEFTRRRLGKRTEAFRYCSRACKDAHERGPNKPGWQGGRFQDADGYIRVRVPEDHPARFTERSYAHEHTIVAMEKLGRPLRSGEVVHHVNGDRADNRPENLEVMTTSQHQKLHRRLDKIGY